MLKLAHHAANTLRSEMGHTTGAFPLELLVDRCPRIWVYRARVAPAYRSPCMTRVRQGRLEIVVNSLMDHGSQRCWIANALGHALLHSTLLRKDLVDKGLGGMTVNQIRHQNACFAIHLLASREAFGSIWDQEPTWPPDRFEVARAARMLRISERMAELAMGHWYWPGQECADDCALLRGGIGLDLGTERLAETG